MVAVPGRPLDRGGAKRYRPGDSDPPLIDITPGTGTVRRRIAGMVQLSEADAYAGGELRIPFAHHVMTAPRARGSLIALPAWTEHELARVSAGERWVLLVDGDVEQP